MCRCLLNRAGIQMLSLSKCLEILKYCGVFAGFLHFFQLACDDDGCDTHEELAFDNAEYYICWDSFHFCIGLSFQYFAVIFLSILSSQVE